MSDMTSAVAIDLLDNLIGMVDDNQGNDYDSALHMAIDALKAQADSDTISRQAVLDAIFSEPLYESGMKKRDADVVVPVIYEKIKSLPSAQPEKHTEERTETHACDCIERQAAIKVIDAVFPVDPMKSEYAQGIACGAALAKTYVEQLPSAQPESKYEYHYDHTDCIWFRPEARNRCPSTCAQYRDGWNDAMNYVFRDGKGYRPYRRDQKYEG